MTTYHFHCHVIKIYGPKEERKYIYTYQKIISESTCFIQEMYANNEHLVDWVNNGIKGYFPTVYYYKNIMV